MHLLFIDGKKSRGRNAGLMVKPWNLSHVVIQNDLYLNLNALGIEFKEF